MKTVLLLLLSILGLVLVCAEVHAEDQYTEDADVVAVDDSAAGSRRTWASWKHKYNAKFDFPDLKADIEVSQTHWDQDTNNAKWSTKFTEFNNDICPGGKLNWHVHEYPVSETASNIRDVGATGNAPGCDASITGGHYDPTFACGGASQNNRVNKIDQAQIEYFASDSTAQKPAGSGNVGPYSPTTVTGPVTASTTEDGELELTWDLSGLEPNASGGIHVHYGTTCESELTVKGDAPLGARLGHYYVPASPDAAVLAGEDPWAVNWESNDAGNAYGSVRISEAALGAAANSAYNRVVIVHNAAGGKVGCGLLQQHMQAQIGYFASDSTAEKPAGSGNVGPYSPDTVRGAVTASTTKDGKLALKWSLSGLEESTSGGIHIHYGNKCESEATIKGDAPTGANLGHYYVPTADANVVTSGEDPWTVKWTSTDAGNAHGSAEISKDALGAAVNSAYNRVVIVHNAAGGKVGCGVLARENLCNTLRASNQAPAGNGKVQGPYTCSPDNQSQCEIGDQSGKMGKLDASNINQRWNPARTKWDRWMEPITNLAGRSMVLHCCSAAGCGARLACANLEPVAARRRRRKFTRQRRRGGN